MAPSASRCGCRSAGGTPKRVLHGAINIRSGDLALLITEDWTRDSHEAFLRLIRAHWRGWNLVVFEDRATNTNRLGSGPGKPEDRDPVTPASDPGIECHGPPLEAPRGETLGDRATQSIEASALAACQYLIDLSPHDRLQKAGVLSGHFWLNL